jgi:hypothetical protein
MSEWSHSVRAANTVVTAIPAHTMYILARVARSLADDYTAFADELNHADVGDSLRDGQVG